MSYLCVVSLFGDSYRGCFVQSLRAKRRRSMYVVESLAFLSSLLVVNSKNATEGYSHDRRWRLIRSTIRLSSVSSASSCVLSGSAKRCILSSVMWLTITPRLYLYSISQFIKHNMIAKSYLYFMRVVLRIFPFGLYLYIYISIFVTPFSLFQSVLHLGSKQSCVHII